LLKKLARATLKVEALIKKSLITNIITVIYKKQVCHSFKKTTGATLKVVALIKKQV
jgi:hypothetical protein